MWPRYQLPVSQSGDACDSPRATKKDAISQRIRRCLLGTSKNAAVVRKMK